MLLVLPSTPNLLFIEVVSPWMLPQHQHNDRYLDNEGVSEEVVAVV